MAANFAQYGTPLDLSDQGSRVGPDFSSSGTELDLSYGGTPLDAVEPQQLGGRPAEAVADVGRSLATGVIDTPGMTLRGLGETYGAAARTIGRPIQAGLEAVGLEGVGEFLFEKPVLPWWLDPAEVLKRPGQVIGDVAQKADVPAERQNVATDIAKGVGQLSAQVTAAILSGGVASSTNLAMLFGQGVDQQRALRDEYAPGSITPEADAALLGGGVITAATERVGLDQVLNRLPPKVKNSVLRYLADISVAGGIEAVQEVAEGVMQRLTAAAAHGVDIPVLEGVGREAIAAGGAGAIVRGLINVATPGRGRDVEIDTATDTRTRPVPETNTAEGIVKDAAERLRTLEAQPDISYPEQVERDFLRQHGKDAKAVAEAYGVSILPDTGRPDLPPPTPGDIESPLPTALIQEGKAILDDALRTAQEPRREETESETRTETRPQADPLLSPSLEAATQPVPPLTAEPLDVAGLTPIGAPDDNGTGTPAIRDVGLGGSEGGAPTVPDFSAAGTSLAGLAQDGRPGAVGPRPAGGAPVPDLGQPADGQPALSTTPAPQDFTDSVKSGGATTLRGERIDAEWTRFTPESGTLEIPRDAMPQIKAEHRGALANFLKARDIAGTEETVPAASLKPTQAEFSEKKVQKAKDFEGGDRAILVSSDGHVLDGHHQWLAKADAGEDVRIIRLGAPIQQLLDEVKEFPSVEGLKAAPDAAPITVTEKGADRPDGWTQVGRNADGVMLYEDKRGARSYLTRGVRVTEPVQMVPGREGAQVYVDKDRRGSEYKTAAELGRPESPAMETVSINLRDRTISVESEKPTSPTLPMEVEFNGRRYPVESIADAQAKWNEFRQQTGAGASDIGSMKVFQGGQQVARISYNGRAWDMQDRPIGEGGPQRPDPNDPEAKQQGTDEEILARTEEALGEVADDTGWVGINELDHGIAIMAQRRGRKIVWGIEVGDSERIEEFKTYDAAWQAAQARIANFDERFEPWPDPDGEVALQGERRTASADIFPAPTATFSIEKKAKQAGRLTQEQAHALRKQWKAVATKVRMKYGKENEKKVILSLFDDSGEWSKPWLDAGYQVVQADKFLGTDLMRQNPAEIVGEIERQIGKIHGILAACPCTSFAGTGAQWWHEQHDTPNKAMVEKKYGPTAAKYFDRPVDYGVALVAITEEYIALTDTEFHVLENPVGRIAEMADLPMKNGKPLPTAQFQPHNFGDPYSKRTQLFGKFNPDMPVADVEPTEGSKMQSKLRGYTIEGKRERSLTPAGFAYSFFLANDPHAAEFLVKVEQPTQSESQAPQDQAVQRPEGVRLARHFAEAFADGQVFQNITEARKFAAEFLGRPVQAGTLEAKAVDEAIELGAVLAARDIIQEGRGTRETYDALVDLYGRMPKLSTRTSTSVEQQAYSTPLPLAYLAGHVAGISRETTVYEPSAGNGALVLAADPKKVTANELNRERVANLRATLPGATIKAHDAAAWVPRGEFDVMIANPPFGIVKDDAGETRRFQVNEQYETGEIDHAIALKALGAMADDGSAVLIVGSVSKLKKTEDQRSDAYNTKAKREFYLTLYRGYNVVDHYTVSGSLYERQGAGWPVDVIVIRGRGPSARKVPAADPPRIYTSWDGLREALDANYPTAEAGPRAPVRDGARAEPGPRDRDDGDRPRSGEARPDRQPVKPAPGEPAVVREGPVDGQPGDTRPAEPRADDRPAESDRPAKPARRAPVETGDRQVAYRPSSRAAPMDTLVPVNMQTAVLDALDGLRARVGDLDAYVADRLGYDAAKLGDYFGAEQVDAIALALDNMERGAGFIIGDQTGIGKGRVVAAIIRYALRSNRTPIFVTEKPNLYGDMYRDLNDIGVTEMLGRVPKILMTNAGQSVPLDEKGTTLKSSGAAVHNRLLRDMTDAGRLDGYDMVFTTYSQMQTLKGARTPRMDFLDAIAKGGIVVFDESHNAGGSTKGDREKKPDEAPNRAEFARKLSREAHGVFYSSATYAKRPDVMDLYATTDMRLAVSDISKLADAIQKGGVPMQQVVASMLSSSGQYLRRERSFDGVVYNSPVVEVPKATYSAYSRALADIQVFSEKVIQPLIKVIDKDLKADGKSISGDGSTGGAGASSTNFTSVMHNLVDQMLLSIKADIAADKAIEAIKAGQKPVITVSNTMGAFIKDYTEDIGASPGDRLDINFNTLLERYLDRTRRVTVRKPFMKKGEKGEHLYLTDEMIGPAAVEKFNAIRDSIRAADLAALPVSPIDHIRMRLAREGYTVGEITGRTETLDYRKDGTYYRARPGREVSIAGRRKSIADFNGGKIDAMILNQAGSTGLSLHASKTFKDQKKRRMIIAQAEKNIDTHMQMLGRVHRTGQVTTPEYDQLVADVPAEKRPAAVLAKKMASLNANTTGSRGGALTAEDVPDFMNEYGDEVAFRVMEDMPEIHKALGEPLKGEKTEDAMRRVTGRIPLLKIEDQEMVYEVLESEYKSLLDQKEASGESVLEAKTLNFDAVIKGRKQVVAPTGDNSPFADGVYVEEADVKRLGKPHPTEKVLGMLAESLEIPMDSFSAENLQPAIKAGQQAAQEAWIETQKALTPYKREVLDDIEDDKQRQATETRLDGLTDRLRALLRTAHVGQSVRLVTEVGNFYGVVTKVKHSGKAKNPVALGSWKVTVAMTDASKQITLSMSQLFTRDTEPSDLGKNAIIIEPAANIMADLPVIKAFDQFQIESREERTIITGNILAGFDHVNGKGAIINFTDRDGGVRQGIVMPRGYNYDKARAEQPVEFRTAGQVLAFADRGYTVDSADEAVKITATGDTVRIDVAASKARGGKYYLDRGVRAAAGKDFVKVSERMRVEIPRGDAARVIDELKRAGAGLRANEALKVAREIAGSVGGGEAAPAYGLSKEAFMRGIDDAEGRLSIGRDAPWYYSALARAAEGLKQAKGSPEQMLAMLKKQPGVKAEELEWTGLPEFMAAQGKSVTREQIVEYLAGNGVQVETVTLGGGDADFDDSYVPDYTWTEFDPDPEDPNVLRFGVVADAEQVGFDVYIDNDADTVAVQVDDTQEWLPVRAHDLPHGRPYAAEQAMTEYLVKLADAENTAAGFDGPTKYANYQLDGGDNYREVLLTLPTKPNQRDLTAMSRKELDDLYKRHVGYSIVDDDPGITDAQIRQMLRGYEVAAANAGTPVGPADGSFTSSHFDQPNVLAHVRLNDRTGPSGEKILFVEELQSDWHQRGRKFGYDNTDRMEGARKELAEINEGWVEIHQEAMDVLEGLDLLGFSRLRDARQAVIGHADFATRWDIPPDDAATLQEYRALHIRRSDLETALEQGVVGRAVPDAPFKGNAWAELSIKRILRLAAEGGYDQVAWTTGEQQADRYDLSKQVDALNVVGYPSAGEGKLILAAWKDGAQVIQKTIDEADLDSHIGKEAAEKISKMTPDPVTGLRRLEGEALKVGGHGMIGFYDRTLPNLLKKVAGKLDKAAQTGETTIKADNAPEGVVTATERRYGADHPLVKKNRMPVHAITITPAMREGAMAGQPLFAALRQAAAGAEALEADLKARLKQVGIDEKVGVKLVDAIRRLSDDQAMSGVEGRYLARLIEVAAGARNRMWVMDHEIIHALRDLGVIRDAEWAALAKAVTGERLDDIRSRYAGRNLSEDQLLEEAIADLHADWTTSQQQVRGFVRTAFQRIRDFLEALGNALRGIGFESAGGVFRRIGRGEVGRRRGFSGEEPREAFTTSGAGMTNRLLLEATQDLARATSEMNALRARLDYLGDLPTGPFSLKKRAEDERALETDLQSKRAEVERIKQRQERLYRSLVPRDTQGRFISPDLPRYALPPGGFDPERARRAVAFDNPEAERRWQEARKGVAGQQTLVGRVRDRLTTIAEGFARHFIHLPNEPRFSEAREQLRKIESAPQASKEEAVRVLRDIVRDMSREDLDLFTRKVVLDDLSFEVDQQHQLPFGFTPADVRRELEKVDAALTHELRRRVEIRNRLVKRVANDLVRAGVLTREQVKNPAYYRHQVLDYARAQVQRAKTPGKKLKSPHWARRMGSQLDINANLLEAEFEWLQKALTDIAVADTIEWFKRSDYNVRNETIAAARDHNKALVDKLLAKDLRDNGYIRNGRSTSPLNEEWMRFKQRIAIGLKDVRQAIESGNVRVPSQFARTAERLVDGDGGGADLFPFLSWMIDTEQPGEAAAKMVFKAINQRKAWVRVKLGDRYADPLDIEGLVKKGFAPEGYKAWQPDEGKLLYTAKTLPEHAIDRMLARIAEDGAGTMTAQDLMAALDSVRSILAVGGAKYQMILPGEVVDTLNSIRDEDADGLISAVFEKPLGLWKRWVLINPRRVLKYNLNNLSGDLDAVIAGKPSVLKKLPQAIGELWQVMIKGKTPTARYREAVERGVFDSGLTIQEIPDINYLSEFEDLINRPNWWRLDKQSMRVALRIWRTLQRYTWFRENWMRYAAYLDYVERIEGGEDMRSIGYGAGNRKMVQAVSDPKDRAALLARELVGDYGAISHYGKGLRRKVIPFYSWLEINTKRYWRLGSNAWDQGIGHGFRTAGIIGATLGVRTTAYLTLRMAVLYGLVQIWNNLVMGDEEDELSAEERARLHLILGRDSNGDIRTLRFQGALSDFMAWFGFENAVAAAIEVEKGRASLGDIMAAIAKAPVNKVLNGVTPIISAPVEYLSGKKYWPDVFNPRQIRDRSRNLAQLFSVEHEYDLIFDRPSRGYGRSVVDTLTYGRDPGENAYNRMKGMAYDWQRRVKGVEGTGGYVTPRSQALYEWRLAKKFGDTDAERKAYGQMQDLGVDRNDLRTSIRRAHPLGNLAFRDRGAFLRTLTPKERELLDTAIVWYEETYVD